MSVRTGFAVHAFGDDALGNTSYLVDLRDGTAASVDPPRDVDAHLAEADRLGLRIVAALETHLHADFVSGGRELVEAVGAEVFAAPDAALAIPHRSAGDGAVVRLGEATVRVIGTPGHTPEHVAYVFEHDGQPSAVFSGGALIFGGAARTDLTGDDRTEELARAEFRSLRRLAALPDDLALHPTHGAGSFCSAGPARQAEGTLGSERRTNPLLRIGDEDAFVRELLSTYGSYPPYFLHLRDVNRRGAPLVRDLEAPRPIEPTDVRDAMDRGVWLIDARSAREWAARHPVGAVSNALRPQFASWLGWIVPFGDPVILLIAEADLPYALRLARRIGYDAIVGWVDGGIDAWMGAGLPVASAEEVGASEASDRMRTGTPLVDVRQDSEVRSGSIPGALHVELGDIIAGRVPEVAEAITTCGHGERSATAASLLERQGIRVINLVGGFQAWERAGLPIAR